MFSKCVVCFLLIFIFRISGAEVPLWGFNCRCGEVVMSSAPRAAQEGLGQLDSLGCILLAGKTFRCQGAVRGWEAPLSGHSWLLCWAYYNNQVIKPAHVSSLTF